MSTSLEQERARLKPEVPLGSLRHGDLFFSALPEQADPRNRLLLCQHAGTYRNGIEYFMYGTELTPYPVELNPHGSHEDMVIPLGMSIGRGKTVIVETGAVIDIWVLDRLAASFKPA